jgi:hypothetical protein
LFDEEIAALESEGHWEKVVVRLAEERARLERQLTDMRQTLADKERRAAIEIVAARYNLSEDNQSRLNGQTEEELDKDARELVKMLPPVRRAPSDLTNGRAVIHDAQKLLDARRKDALRKTGRYRI